MVSVDKSCLQGVEGNTSAIKLAVMWEDEKLEKT